MDFFNNIGFNLETIINETAIIIIMALSDKKFREYFEKKVRTTIRKYKMFTKKERIAVAVSGGKDSTVCLYILKKLGYNVEGITIDAAIGNYTEINLENLKEVCNKYDIKLNIISFKEEFGKSLCYMRSVLKSKGHDYSSCMLCGILKRYLLNKYSRKWKFDYLATGHNLDDEAQAFLMNVFRNDFKLAERQGPKPGLFNVGNFVQRVKPLYLLLEEEVKRYSKIMKFPVNYEMCPCSTGAYRREFKNALDDFEKKYPSVKYNVIRFQETMSSRLRPREKVKINTCESCGEPAAKEICNTCRLFMELEN